jgi:DNA ligase-associated metallophosphoesterase
LHNIIEHTVLDNIFLLSAERCIFWQEEKALILSDLHLGKSGHFRKAGIAIPQAVFREDMQRLFSLIQSFKPAKIIVVGDLFHSHNNKEHDLFLKWRNDFIDLPIELVKGNHDILKPEWYAEASIIIHPNELTIGDFSFTHDNAGCASVNSKYTFCGHIHPGIIINGLGRQSLKFPCFYFSEGYAVLPAFGRFTGTHRIEPKELDNVFAIVKNDIVKIQ